MLETITHANSSWKRRTREEIQAELDRSMANIRLSNLASAVLVVEWLNSEEPVDNDKIANLFVEMKDFNRALSIVHPSAKREGFATVPDVSWEDIGALQEVRAQLEWSILVGFTIAISDHLMQNNRCLTTNVLSSTRSSVRKRSSD